MAEPENFEDDLFADLYEDDTAKPAPPAPEIRSPPAVVNGSSAVRTEESASAEVVTTDEQEYKEEVEQDDDEIDFNLGGGAHDYSAPAHHEREREHGPGIKEDGKMFIGGLNWETTDQSLKDYFSQFGEVLECTVMRDGASGRSRGFGFLTFKDPRTVNVVMVKEHYLDGKIIDPKRAIPRDEQERTSKIFVGGVSQEASEQDFKEYFTQFGRVVDATLMMDKDTGRPRGFGFVTFDSEAAVEACLNIPLEILGKPIEVKKAQPRGNVREEEDRGGRNRFRKTEEQHESFSTQQQSQSNQMAPGGMTPQVMAQYWQRMQQYFAMMQQQMAMGAGRGGAMNPAMNPAMMNPMMMQQMQQMQAMQAMQAAQQQGGGGARSQSPQGPQSPSMNMNPAMMNPMMLQQMQSMQRSQQMGGGATPAPAQGRGTPGYNAYEQQAFEQQKYETQQVRRGRQTSQTPAAGQFGQGAYGANQPTSWEGMYDDVPQPIPSGGGAGAYKGHGRGGSAVSGGPQPAPPAGAPTGPKNAGKPGANYRGGGRAGRGGYHPYSR